jgi:group I intron endonuclease
VSLLFPESSNSISGIYEIRNIVDGKIYIGSAVVIRRRISRHKTDLRGGSHHCSHLQRAWNKYGENCFVFSTLQVIEKIEELIKNEQKWIDLKKSANADFGYNAAPNAGSALGVKFTPESKAAKAQAMRGKKHTPERCMNMSLAMRGKRHSVETRIKMSLERKGLKRNPDSVIKMAITQRGSKRPKIQGVKNSSAKLTEEMVIKIRHLHANGGTTYKGLGRMFGVSNFATKSAILGKTWAHIPLTEGKGDSLTPPVAPTP